MGDLLTRPPLVAKCLPVSTDAGVSPRMGMSPSGSSAPYPSKVDRLQSYRRRNIDISRYFSSPLPDPNRRNPLLTPCAPNGNRSQPAARFSLDSAVLAPAQFATGCHRLQPRGSIKAQILRCHVWLHRLRVAPLLDR